MIKPDAIVTGDIRVEAGQLVQIQGSSEGKVTGNYQVFDWPDQPRSNFDGKDNPEIDADAAKAGLDGAPAGETPEQEPAGDSASPQGLH